MATKEGKRKRAWRKPRQEIGPEPAAGDQPIATEPVAKRASQSATQENKAAINSPSLGAGEEEQLVIDGSVMEGGGQILRNAMALSCLLQRPIRIIRIRAGRDKPGLKPQHLTGIKLLSEMTRGKLVAAGVGSDNVSFTPGPLQAGSFTADTQTAGSVCLILQAALPCLLFSPGASRVVLKGGTNADMAPPIDFTIKVFQPIAARFGVNFDCQIVRRGFFPKGRGEVVVTTPIRPTHLTAVTMTDPGTIVRICIHTFVAGAVPLRDCSVMVAAARRLIEKEIPGVSVEDTQVQETRESAFGNSSGIIVVAETSTGCLLAGSANGRKSISPAQTAESAARDLIAAVHSGACVDEHLQDQLVILMALAKGKSTINTGPLTLHTKTAIHIAETLTKARFTTETVCVAGRELHLLHCEGIGLETSGSTRKDL